MYMWTYCQVLLTMYALVFLVDLLHTLSWVTLLRKQCNATLEYLTSGKKVSIVHLDIVSRFYFRTHRVMLRAGQASDPDHPKIPSRWDNNSVVWSTPLIIASLRQPAQTSLPSTGDSADLFPEGGVPALASAEFNTTLRLARRIRQLELHEPDLSRLAEQRLQDCPCTAQQLRNKVCPRP